MKKLNFGCGDDIKEGWDNVDIQKSKKLIKSFDFNKFPYPIKDNTYSYVYSSNVFEHLEEPKKVLKELWRICKKNAVIEIIVPHYTNKGAYDELAHEHYFSEKAFVNFVNGKCEIVREREKFRVVNLELTPTSVGKFFPGVLRKKLSLFINGLISQIYIKLKVVK